MKLRICLFLAVFAWMGTAHGQSRSECALSAANSPATAGATDVGNAAVDTTAAGGEERKDDPAAMKRNLRLISRQEVPGERKWQRRKSPRVAMVSAMVLPGLGQLYNGRRIKTMLMVGVSGFYMSKIWLEHKNAQRRKQLRDSYPVNSSRWRDENLWYDYHKELTRDFAWWSGAVWIIGVLDAYIDAHLYDVRAYRPSREGNGDQTSYLTVNFSF